MENNVNTNLSMYLIGNDGCQFRGNLNNFEYQYYVPNNKKNAEKEIITYELYGAEAISINRHPC